MATPQNTAARVRSRERGCSSPPLRGTALVGIAWSLCVGGVEIADQRHWRTSAPIIAGQKARRGCWGVLASRLSRDRREGQGGSGKLARGAPVAAVRVPVPPELSPWWWKYASVTDSALAAAAGPPGARSVIPRSAHFMMSISARTGGRHSLPRPRRKRTTFTGISPVSQRLVDISPVVASRTKSS